jgi:hypothetical protein
MSDGPIPTIPLEDAYRIQLERSLGPVSYSDLRAHLERDSVFIVAPSLSLLDCAVAVAMDDVAKVKGFIDSGELRKPGKSERATWAESGGTWTAVVVQPFVLVQVALT